MQPRPNSALFYEQGVRSQFGASICCRERIGSCSPDTGTSKGRVFKAPVQMLASKAAHAVLEPPGVPDFAVDVAPKVRPGETSRLCAPKAQAAGFFYGMA